MVQRAKVLLMCLVLLCAFGVTTKAQSNSPLLAYQLYEWVTAETWTITTSESYEIHSEYGSFHGWGPDSSLTGTIENTSTTWGNVMAMGFGGTFGTWMGGAVGAAGQAWALANASTSAASGMVAAGSGMVLTPIGITAFASTFAY